MEGLGLMNVWCGMSIRMKRVFVVDIGYGKLMIKVINYWESLGRSCWTWFMFVRAKEHMIWVVLIEVVNLASSYTSLIDYVGILGWCLMVIMVGDDMGKVSKFQ